MLLGQHGFPTATPGLRGQRTSGSIAATVWSARRGRAAGYLVLSQILVCRDCEASSPLLVWPLRGESVELFGRTAARLTASFELPFAQHVHQLNAGEGGLRGVERLESSHRPGHAFHGAMVLLHDVIEILDLADLDGRPVLLIISLDGRFVGRTSVNGDGSYWRLILDSGVLYPP